MDKKLCKECGRVRLIKFFSRKGKWYQHICKDCNKKYQRGHYNINKTSYKVKAKEYKKKVLAEVQYIKENAPCVDCGKYYPHYIMDFDHTEDNKSMNVADLVRSGSSKAVREEIAKCDLVCANCHRERTWQRIH